MLQYNKRDLPNALAIERTASALNKYNSVDFEGTASEGKGVFESLRTVSKVIINVLRAATSNAMLTIGPFRITDIEPIQSIL